ncbi:unnamed protein product [Prorocentrum cordatum]|uniref:Uncharacterized protein n=1 Tax=Prorocentrum cordatum TaxID=2364126 RepID=A0ABN9UI65_9DINO|nr:unnamed protein product [Polarella glacialis]
MAEGRVLVELMPHLRALRPELCRGTGWDSTPMYAYGGLGAAAGLRHLCLVGRADAGEAEAPASLARELGSWIAAPVRVDVRALTAVLGRALRYLDAERAAGECKAKYTEDYRAHKARALGACTGRLRASEQRGVGGTGDAARR